MSGGDLPPVLSPGRRRRQDFSTGVRLLTFAVVLLAAWGLVGGIALLVYVLWRALA
jgi:hypothetical protein